jgi:hypothetical protein
MLRGVSARLIFAAATLGLGAAPALAHHSLALFNRTISRDVEGVVKDYKFANPHVRLTLAVANPDGSTTDWEFESSSVSRMIARGFNRVTARIGDTVTVHYNPMRSGKPGGFLAALTDSRGRKYGPVEDR